MRDFGVCMTLKAREAVGLPHTQNAYDHFGLPLLAQARQC